MEMVDGLACFIDYFILVAPSDSMAVAVQIMFTVIQVGLVTKIVVVMDHSFRILDGLVELQEEDSMGKNFPKTGFDLVAID